MVRMLTRFGKSGFYLSNSFPYVKREKECLRQEVNHPRKHLYTQYTLHILVFTTFSAGKTKQSLTAQIVTQQ